MSSYPPPFPYIDTVIEVLAVFTLLCVPILLVLYLLEQRTAARQITLTIGSASNRHGDS